MIIRKARPVVGLRTKDVDDPAQRPRLPRSKLPTARQATQGLIAPPRPDVRPSKRRSERATAAAGMVTSVNLRQLSA